MADPVAASSTRNDEFVQPPESDADVCHNSAAAKRQDEDWISDRAWIAVMVLALLFWLALLSGIGYTIYEVTS